MVSFQLLLYAFNNGYNCIGNEDDWPYAGVTRWAYRMGRRQIKHTTRGCKQ